ncbi:glutamate racemase [Bizionia sediminis]|uniref:Glutamate racemase n=1 Tax=Bizionia sediminis TaxID=1737064 RepID=A0ABW5KUS0_9FLAO
MHTKPIGIFDSGVGGTSIWSALNQRLPHEDTIYLADSKNSPYGTKTQQEIIQLSIKNTKHLIANDCKLIVVACNTATTNAIKILREKFTIPFIGIEPAIKPAALHTKTKAIGILATRGTLSSELFHRITDLYSHNVKVLEQEGAGIVQLIESGQLESEAMTQLLKQYLQPMIAANVDHLVLGCTHYPYLIPQLKKLLPPEVKIIDSGEAVARQTEYILNQHQLLNTQSNKAKCLFYTNTQTKVLASLIEQPAQVHYLDF